MDLILTEELARLFVGGLLTIARADGEVNTEEARELRAISDELAGPFELDFEMLMFDHVNASQLGDALVAIGAGPFRGANVSAPARIAMAFMEAARRIANADGEINPDENTALRAFARALRI